MDTETDPLATMTPEVRAALERYVSHRRPGASPYFPDRHFDNEAWTKDVATLAAAFASGVSPRAVGPGDCKACEGSGRQSVVDGPIAVTARKRWAAVGPEEVEAAWRTVKAAIWAWAAIGKDDDEAISDLELESRVKAELVKLPASRLGYDAGFAAGVKSVADQTFTSANCLAVADAIDESLKPPGADRDAGKGAAT